MKFVVIESTVVHSPSPNDLWWVKSPVVGIMHFPYPDLHLGRSPNLCHEIRLWYLFSWVFGDIQFACLSWANVLGHFRITFDQVWLNISASRQSKYRTKYFNEILVTLSVPHPVFSWFFGKIKFTWSSWTEVLYENNITFYQLWLNIKVQLDNPNTGWSISNFEWNWSTTTFRQAIQTSFFV